RPAGAARVDRRPARSLGEDDHRPNARREHRGREELQPRRNPSAREGADRIGRAGGASRQPRARRRDREARRGGKAPAAAQGPRRGVRGLQRPAGAHRRYGARCRRRLGDRAQERRAHGRARDARVGSADSQKALAAGRARHGAHLRRAHERHGVRLLRAARRARVLGRRAARAGEGRRRDRARRARPRASGAYRRRGDGAAQEGLARAAKALRARLRRAVLPAHPPGERGLRFRLPRRHGANARAGNPLSWDALLGAEGDLIVRRLQALAAFLAFGAPAPDAVAAACLGIDFATVHNYRFLNSEKRERFATVERKLCNYVAEGGATKERAARFAETWIFRNIYCDGAKPDANFWRETLKIGILPPSADRFCRETDEALSKVYEELPRMEIDIFCAQSAAPFPNRMMALTLSDLP